MSDAALTREIANDIYTVLVEECNAPESSRAHFVHVQSRQYVPEWRFQGSLGYGGKFWRNHGLRPDNRWGEIWYVNAYPEDLTSQINDRAGRANKRLAALLLDEEV